MSILIIITIYIQQGYTGLPIHSVTEPTQVKISYPGLGGSQTCWSFHSHGYCLKCAFFTSLLCAVWPVNQSPTTDTSVSYSVPSSWKLLSFLSSDNLISPSHSAYHYFDSTDTALLKVTNVIFSALNRGNISFLIAI